MFRKLALGLFAAASLGALALTPSTASAKGWGWGWGGFHHHHFGYFGPGFGVTYVGGYDGCYIVRRVPTPFGYRLRTINVCD